MKKRLVLPVVALLLFTGCVSRGTYDLKAKEAQSLAAKTEDLQAQVKGLTADVEGLKKERTALQQEKEAAQKDITALQAKVGELAQKAEKAEQLEKATQTYEDLKKKLEKEIQEGQVQITEMKNRLTVTMVDQILFASGSAEVGKKGKAVVENEGTILKGVTDKRI